jgi:hypothetical protein
VTWRVWMQIASIGIFRTSPTANNVVAPIPWRNGGYKPAVSCLSEFTLVADWDETPYRLGSLVQGWVIPSQVLDM